MKRLLAAITLTVLLFPSFAFASGASSAPFNPSAVSVTGGTISGTVSYPPPFALASIRGAATVSITGSTFSSSNVTLTGGCSISAGTVVCGTSAGTFYPISWTPTSGIMYQIDLVPSAVTSNGRVLPYHGRRDGLWVGLHAHCWAGSPGLYAGRERGCSHNQQRGRRRHVADLFLLDR